MNWRRSCITDAFGPQKQTRPIYNMIVQYEQSIVKYAEKWRKILLKYDCAIWTKYSQICWKMEENITQNRIHVYI